MKNKEKVFLCLGQLDENIQKTINKTKIDIVDYEDNINLIEDALDIVDMDILIINRMLDKTENGDILFSISSKARKRDIKIIVLLEEMESSKERKLITRLINEDVTSFLIFKEITKRKIEKNVKKYPKEFDFKTFSKTRIKYKEVIKTTFKEVYVVYSPLSQGTSTVASHLAVSIARTQNCRVCLVDLNPLKPSFKKIFSRDFDNTIVNVFNSMERNILSNEKLEGLITTSKEQKNLDILPGFYDINEYYALANNNSFNLYIDRLIEKLKFLYDYVVIDIHSWHDLYTSNQALAKADKVIVPLYGNTHDIGEINRYTDAFRKYGDFDTRKFMFVVNKYSGEDLTFIEIETSLRGKVVGYISENKAYRKGNVFNNRRLMNEYISILKSLGFKAEKNLFIHEKLFNRKIGLEGS